MGRQTNLSRRNLLRGVPVSAAPPLRPPGAIEESLFTDTCTTCGECIEICPQRIIVRGSAGYPEVDFTGAECTFCEECIDGCPENALQRSVQPRWRWQPQLQENCLAQRQVVCQTCGDVCEVRAIRFRPRLGATATPEVDGGTCTGCGACVAACPENALTAVAHD